MNPPMTIATSALATHHREGARSRIARTRRVRSSYPAALVELALVLCNTVGTRRAASVLGVGMSTIYRWVELHRTAWMPHSFVPTDRPSSGFDDAVVALSTRCERAGFSVHSSALNGDVTAATKNIESPATDDIGLALLRNIETSRIAALDDVSTHGIPASEKMVRAKREIDENFATRLSCQRLADVVAMPRFQFIKKFTATFGAPPYHYLLSVRVKRAWEVLQRSDSTLPAVAAATGFGSTASMQRAFKRFAGASPGKVVNVISSVRNFLPADSYVEQLLPDRDAVSASRTYSE